MELKCEVCGRGHATWEHKTFEKLRLAETGMPLDRLFTVLDCSELTPEQTTEQIDKLARDKG